MWLSLHCFPEAIPFSLTVNQASSSSPCRIELCQRKSPHIQACMVDDHLNEIKGSFNPYIPLRAIEVLTELAHYIELPIFPVGRATSGDSCAWVAVESSLGAGEFAFLLAETILTES
eukprot:84191-Hanusia_phi.AAC.2